MYQRAAARVGVLALLCLAAFVLFSCSNGLLKDPRLYNSKNKSAGSGAITVAPEPELNLTGGVDVFDDLDQWYNNPNSNGDGSSDKLDFPAEEFEQMSLVGTYFDGSNVPVYAMKKENVWLPKDTAKAEFVHANAPDTTGQGYGISKVHWYQYRGRNPLYAPDGGYNTQLLFTASGNPKLSRFYFYRFTGDTLSPSLDNFLFAVDTYSKLMFAFAKPTKMESVLGNQVPKAWGPTDGEKFLGTDYQFYMYDPVGYVLKEGEGSYKVEMYDWFKKNLAKGVYEPTLGGLDRNSQGTPLDEVASKKPGGAGKSPFNNHTVNFFEENMKLLGKSGVEFLRRETINGHDGLVLYKYKVSTNGKIITRTAESWNGLPTSTSLETVTYTVGAGSTATKGAVIQNGSSDPMTIELADASYTLRFSNGDVARFDFDDPGPAFIERVKHNPTYEKGVTKYVFSDDGKTLTMTYDPIIGSTTTSTYTYQKQESNSQARYSGYLVQLYSHDNDIKCSTVASVAVWASKMEYLAHLKRETGATFIDTVKGMTFSVRKKDGQGLHNYELESIKFDGSTATIKKDYYENTSASTSASVSVANGSSQTQATLDEKPVSLNLLTTPWTIDYEGTTYEASYSDPGPAWLYRVKGKTFEGSGYTYTFSADGKTIALSNDKTYIFQKQDANDRAVYQEKDAPWYVFGCDMWGLRLADNDQTLYFTETAWASAGTTPTSNANSSPAKRKMN